MKRIKLISTCTCIFLIFAYVLLLIISWNNISDTVPVHFDSAGNVDNFAGKGSLIFEPILSLLLLGLFIFIENTPKALNYPVKITEENKDRLHNVAIIMMSLLKLLSILTVLSLGMAIIMELSLILAYLMMIMIFLVIIIGIIKMVKLK